MIAAKHLVLGTSFPSFWTTDDACSATAVFWAIDNAPPGCLQVVKVKAIPKILF